MGLVFLCAFNNEKDEMRRGIKRAPNGNIALHDDDSHIHTGRKGEDKMEVINKGVRRAKDQE